jgi:hypothetical protein
VKLEVDHDFSAGQFWAANNCISSYRQLVWHSLSFPPLESLSRTFPNRNLMPIAKETPFQMHDIAQWLQWRQDTPQRMDRTLQPAISIQIILPEDPLAAKSNGEPTVRHSGDKIRGHLEVITCGTFDFEVSLSFEGLIFGFPACFSSH